MSFDYDPEAKLQVFGGRLIENKNGLIGSGVPHSMMARRLLEQLSNKLATDAITITEDEYTVQHELRVYVLTPSQLEKYVQRRAERLHEARPDPRWIE